jgi:prolipoprotein diacylglyceryltransferase
VPWAFVFERVDRLPRHPVQLYEGIWYLALAAALLVLGSRWRQRAGVLSGLFLVGMFVPRFFIEFAKDSPVVFAGLNTGQALSLPFIALGALILSRSEWRAPILASRPGTERRAGVPRTSRGERKRRRAR